MNKVCRNCGKDSSTKWYAGPLCRNCYTKNRRANDPDLVARLKKIAKKTREKNAGKIKIKMHEYYLVNREKLIQANSNHAKAKRKPVTGKCCICGNTFTARKGTQCCSNTCRSILNNQRAAARYNPIKHEQECRVCGKFFIKSTKTGFCSAECYQAHKAQDRKERYKNNVNFKIACNVRSRLTSAITNKRVRTTTLVACSWDQLRLHIESLFEPGMTWDNYGRNGWHIDHKTPLNWFDLSDDEQLKKACHYSNLQPMWAEENWSKNDRYASP